uniref:Activin types I and II receptor domain-containing protein n=1 Tax=Strongyloides stercoralis TaxID=6248 RepID=A0A0K0EE04_STRER
MFLQKSIFLIPCIFFIFLLNTTVSLICYKGTSLMKNGKPQETVDCNKRYCYNVTADAGLFFKGEKAGCSTLRCFAAMNKCISTEIQNIPVKFCCCDYDRCN